MMERDALRHSLRQANGTAQAAWARARMACSVRISDAAFTMFFSDAATCIVARDRCCSATAGAKQEATPTEQKLALRTVSHQLLQ